MGSSETPLYFFDQLEGVSVGRYKHYRRVYSQASEQV